MFDAMETVLAELPRPLHIEKMGFARSVLSAVEERRRALNEGQTDPEVEAFLTNMRALFFEITLRQRKAERERSQERVSLKIDRLKNAFVSDHRESASREDVLNLFEEIEAVLDESDESDAIRLIMHQIKREFRIEEDVTEPVQEFSDFVERLGHLRYAARLATQEPTGEDDKRTATGASSDAKRGGNSGEGDGRTDEESVETANAKSGKEEPNKA